MDYYAQSESWWDDLQGPASVAPTGATAPTFDQTYGIYLFSNSGPNNSIWLSFQLRHHYKDATDLKIHVHWCKTTSASGNVLWKAEYRTWEKGAVISGITTLTDSTPDINDGDTAYQHAITDLGAIVNPVTDFSLSDLIQVKLERDNGDAADTYGANAGLIFCDCHYQGRNFGTLNEFSR